VKIARSATPGLIVGIGHNSDPHTALPVQAWLKSVRTVANDGDVIVLEHDAGAVVAEGELAVVIGQTATRLTVENALDHVLGYTIVNDVTSAERNAVDNKNFQSKAGINYTPLGGWIETEIADPENLQILVEVNGRLVASSGTFNLPSRVVDTLVYVTRWMTLEPGDIVMTGSPNTAAELSPGDEVAITIPGIGTLRNTVR
jgi:2-keto-4-pentenoate hydratase/2-oxohepta-3-ene-1,7-dioic acid hydratase in catechol pathway